jgi:hypothetical protein
MLEGGRQGQNGQLLAEEEGDGVGIEAVGFSAAARAGAGEVPDLEGGEAVKGEMGAWRTQEMGLQEGGVGAGGFQAHPPEVGLEGVPGGEEALPAGEVVGEGLEVGLLDGAREGVHDQESGGEGVFGHILLEKRMGPVGRRCGRTVGLSNPTSRFIGAPGPKPLIGVGRRPERNSLRGLLCPHPWRSSGLLPSGPSSTLIHSTNPYRRKPWCAKL